MIDEGLHLVKSFQLPNSGMRLGLWEVDDELCRKVAGITYARVLQDEMTDRSVCDGLHEATRGLRDQWREQMLREEGEKSRLAEITASRRIETHETTCHTPQAKWENSTGFLMFILARRSFVSRKVLACAHFPLAQFQ
jgi:hypothetical protein